MEELLKKLIELDRLARESVAGAEQARADVLYELDEKKLRLKQKKEAECAAALESERKKQSEILQKAQKDISDSCKRKIDALNERYNEKHGEWTEMIFKNVIGG